MHYLNKIMVFILTAILAIGLVGCGTASQSTSGDKENKQEKVEKQTKEKDSKKQEVESQSEEQSKNAEANGKETASTETSTADASTNKTEAEQKTESSKNTLASNSNQDANTAAKPINSAPVAQTTAPKVSEQKPIETVTISIIGPEGTILSPTKAEIKNGDTVMDVLLKVADEKGIDVDYKNQYGAPYVTGIDGYYEGDYEGQSGWTYKLNGVMVQKSAGKSAVKNGDKIVWEYVK